MNQTTVDLQRMLQQFDVRLPVDRSKLKSAFRAKCRLLHPDLNPGGELAFVEMRRDYEDILSILDKNPGYVDASSVEEDELTSDGFPLSSLGNGLETTSNVRECTLCDGRGYVFRTETVRLEGRCTRCNGVGYVRREFPCRKCGGTGQYTNKRGEKVECWTCNGTGIYKHPRLTMRCPACMSYYAFLFRSMFFRTEQRDVKYRCSDCGGTGEILVKNPVLPRGYLKGKADQ